MKNGKVKPMPIKIVGSVQDRIVWLTIAILVVSQGFQYATSYQHNKSIKSLRSVIDDTQNLVQRMHKTNMTMVETDEAFAFTLNGHTVDIAALEGWRDSNTDLGVTPLPYVAMEN